MTSIRTFIDIVESVGNNAKAVPNVTQDDGDVPHAMAAFFDDDAYVRFWKIKTGFLVIQSIASSENIRGRDMLRWLLDTYGLPIVAVEVTEASRGFWSKMKRDGLVKRFTMATGTASPLERQSVPLSESAGGENPPEWFQRGRPLTYQDLERLGAVDYIEGVEWDYEWRLCDVPIEVMPPYGAGGAVPDEDREGRFRSIEGWYRAHGVEKALMTTPIVMLIRLDGRIKVLDGWHRTEIARRQGVKTVTAVVAHGDADSF